MFLLSSDFALSVILSNSGLCYIREAVTPASQLTRLRQEFEYQNTKKSRVPAKSMVAVKSRAPVAHQSIVGLDSQKRALQPFCGGFEHGLQSRYPRSLQIWDR